MAFLTSLALQTGAQAPVPAPAQTAQADSPTVAETVIVTASIAPESPDQVARTVHVLTRQDLDLLGLRSIIDALRLTPEVDPRARGPMDVQTDFSIRGSTFGQNLVLVDGVRVNDTQSGHHDGEIPMAAIGIDRIEVLSGGDSAVYGADALGGAINVISRSDPHADALFEGGQFGFVRGEASASGLGLPTNWAATGWGSHSSGFTDDRQFTIGGGALRGSPRPGLIVDVRHQRRAFGAAGFYGNAPSQEWTDQTLGSVTWTQTNGAWVTTVRGAFRNHGDHFIFTIDNPSLSESRHRTNSADVTASVERETASGAHLTFGTVAGGDWIRSTNLGDRNYGRASAYAEAIVPVAPKTTVQAGLRVDDYSTFGASWNPSAAISTWVSPHVKLRASAAHAFRVPTFTELYYHDPATLGTPTLAPEHGWTVDGGADVVAGPWTVGVSPFVRWDRDVIDFVKAQPADLFTATNVRDVTSKGAEADLQRRWRQAVFRVYYAGLSVDAPSLTLISRYVLEYARHSSGGSIATPIGHGVNLAVNVDHRHRLDGQSYDLVSAKIGKTFSRGEIYLSGSNLLNDTYHEIAGVAMPGRWLMLGVAIR
jgi:iron complex outermembrane receptor protein